MLRIPDWAFNFMKKKECSECGESMKNSIITQVGIKINEENKSCLYYENKCCKCHQVSQTTIATHIDFSPKQLASEILGSYDALEYNVGHKKIVENKEKKNNFSSFEKDCKVFKIFMSNNDSYLEFLKYIGLTDIEIELYARWDKKND